MGHPFRFLVIIMLLVGLMYPVPGPGAAGRVCVPYGSMPVRVLSDEQPVYLS